MPSGESNSEASLRDVKLFSDDFAQSLPRKKTKTVKKSSRSVKIQTSHSEKTADSSSTNRVTSTTSPTVTEQGTEITRDSA